MKSALRLAVAVTLALTFALALSPSARADDPARVWRTIETPHFYIHFYTLPNGGGEEPVAQRLATVTEYCYSRLTPVLGKGLGGKTHVVVTDDIDDYNGFAGVTPYPAVTLFANSPDDRAELNDYDDWLTDLFMHEYTHVIHTGTIGGWIAKTLNVVLGLGLGIQVAPNQLQPRWGLEGLAVFEETARTSSGRLRNAIWDMYLRAQTLEGRFQGIDKISAVPNQFPFGNSAYLYGSALMRYVAEHFGESALLRWSREYGQLGFGWGIRGPVLLPGGLNRSIRIVTGKTWVQLYRDFHDELLQHYSAQRDAIAARGLTPTRVLLPPEANSPARPVFTPDGRDLIVLRSDGYTRQRMARIAVDAPEPPPIGTKIKWLHDELLTDAAGGPSLSADGRLIAYHEQQIVRTLYAYNDLFVYDRTTHKKRRLTEGARAWNPALSPDGAWVAFEMTGNSSRGLGLMRTDSDTVVINVSRGASGATNGIETLIPVANMEHAYTPSWSPDGKTLAFSWWRHGGRRDIYTMDVATRALTQITDDRAYDLEPRFSPDGKWLYFVSDRSGVYNLYAYEFATKKVFQCTNVVNGVFDPAISPDGKTVAFVGFHALGYDLEVAALDPAAWREAPPPLLDRPDATPAPEEPPRPTHWYNPFRTLYPFTWRPYAVPDGYGEILGFNISGSDIVGRHAWSLQLGFGTGRSDDVQFAANYSYSGLVAVLEHGRLARPRAARRPHPQRPRHRLGRRRLVGRHQHRLADLAPHRRGVGPRLLVRLRVDDEQVADLVAGDRSVGADSTAARDRLDRGLCRVVELLVDAPLPVLDLDGVGPLPVAVARRRVTRVRRRARGVHRVVEVPGVGADAVGQSLPAQSRLVAQLFGRRVRRRSGAPQQLLPRRLSAAEPVVVDLRLLAPGLGVAARVQLRLAVRRPIPRPQRRVPLPHHVDRKGRRDVSRLPAPAAWPLLRRLRRRLQRRLLVR